MSAIATSASHVDAAHVQWPAIAFGALAASGTVPVVGILWSLVLVVLMGPFAIVYAPFVVVVATIVGVPVVFVVGVPFATLAWIVLRRVRAEWVHGLLFAALGAMLMLVLCTGAALALGAGSGPAGDLLHGGLMVGACLSPFAILPAIAGRLVTGACVGRRAPASRRIIEPSGGAA